MITDHQYCGFMAKLLADQRQKNSLNLSDWEQRFVASFGQSSRQSLWFTNGRRGSADRMWRRYGAELNFPHPLDCVNERPKTPDADPDGCEFLVRNEGQSLQQRCNQPAVSIEMRAGGTRKGLRYCQQHDEQVRKAFPNMVVIPFAEPRPGNSNEATK